MYGTWKKLDATEARRRRSVGAAALQIVLTLLASTIGQAQTISGQVAVPPACFVTAQPIPSGVTARPPDSFNDYPDYNFVHSSTHLQGQPATEKFAPGLFWLPAGRPDLAAFRSSVIVNNTSRTVSATIDIEYYDVSGGAPLFTSSVTILPEGHHAEGALPISFGSGLGSARIVSTNNIPIVGATVHWTTALDLGPFGGPFLTDPDPFQPGATSMQQLQVRQSEKTIVAMGPLPISDMDPGSVDFHEGNAPLTWVHNPNPTPTNVTILRFTRSGVTLPSNNVVIPGFGTVLDTLLWDLLMPIYVGGALNRDDDVVVYATADQPILGETLMGDFFSPGLTAGGRFRLGSTMMANTPAVVVFNPELTVQPGVVGIQTLMGIANIGIGSGDIGPVRIRYFSRNGAAIGPGDTIASFPLWAMARLGPGQPATPNFPTGPTFDGWVRITACRPGLIGWSMRTSGDQSDAQSSFRKVWGEVLSGSNAQEPGNGFAVVDNAGTTWIRKVSPMTRVDPIGPPPFWPGYTTFLNNAAANVGPYWYRFFEATGNEVTLIAGQPFAGLRFGDTSFTYEDPLVNAGLLMIFPFELNGAVDHTSGRIQGIDVIGDPMAEWTIFDFDN